MVNSNLRECFESLKANNGSVGSSEKTDNMTREILPSYNKNFLDFLKGNGREHR